MIRSHIALIVLCYAASAGCHGILSVNLPGAPSLPEHSSTGSPIDAAPFGGCHLDANCPEHSAWRNVMGSVVDIRASDDPDQHGCTGVLLNNASGDGTPYVLTARHCRTGRADNTGENLSWWKFYFGRTSRSCGADVTSRVPPCRLENNCIIGAEVVVTGTNGEGAFSLSRDFILVRLSRPIPASFNITYAGWSVEETEPQSATVIGHPRGMPMTIAFDHDPARNDISCDGQGMMLRLAIDEGELIMGQSGSPVFDEDKHVRGLVLTGANCTGTARTCASSLLYNWDFGPQGSRLIDHLAGGNPLIRSMPSR